MAVRPLLFLQATLLFGGLVFAWTNLFSQFAHFNALYGTIFRVQGCTVPNPFLTPCFFGSLGFIVAVFWSVHLVQSAGARSERYLRNFLAGCSMFALSVVALETAQYYKLIGGASVSCTPGATPWTTPCFTGMLVFLVAFIVSVVATRRLSAAATIEG